MNEQTNRFKQALEETAYCRNHLTAKVSRNPKTGLWPQSCSRGGYLRKMGKYEVCSIIIEAKDGSYTIH